MHYHVSSSPRLQHHFAYNLCMWINWLTELRTGLEIQGLHYLGTGTSVLFFLAPGVDGNICRGCFSNSLWKQSAEQQRAFQSTAPEVRGSKGCGPRRPRAEQEGLELPLPKTCWRGLNFILGYCCGAEGPGLGLGVTAHEREKVFREHYSLCVCERERESESVSVLEHSSMDMERHLKLVSQGNICF